MTPKWQKSHIWFQISLLITIELKITLWVISHFLYIYKSLRTLLKWPSSFLIQISISHDYYIIYSLLHFLHSSNEQELLGLYLYTPLLIRFRSQLAYEILPAKHRYCYLIDLYYTSLSILWGYSYTYHFHVLKNLTLRCARMPEAYVLKTKL